MKYPIWLLFLLLLAGQPAISQKIQFSYQTGLSSPVKKIIALPESPVVVVIARDGSLVAWHTELNRILLRHQTPQTEVMDADYSHRMQLLLIAGDEGITAISTARLLTHHTLSTPFNLRAENVRSVAIQEPIGAVWVARADGSITRYNNPAALNQRAAKTWRSAVNNPYSVRPVGNNICVLGMHQQAFHQATDGRLLFQSAHYNTGMYGYAHNEKDSLVYLPAEAGAIRLSYKKRRFKADLISIPAEREDVLTLGVGLEQKTGTPFFGNNNGDIVALAAEGPRLHARHSETSFTALLWSGQRLFAGDFFGNVLMLDPVKGEVISQLTEDPTPVVNGVYLTEANDLISTHYGSRGVAIKFWNIATASLQQSFNIPVNIAQQVIANKQGDSILSIHADGAVFLFRRMAEGFRMDTLRAPEMPFMVGGIVFNYELDLQQKRQESGAWLRKLMNEQGVIPIRYTAEPEYDLTIVKGMTVPESCSKKQLPASYRIPEAYLAASNLGAESRDWDILDKDMFYTRACAAENFSVFHEQTSRLNIDSAKIRRFYRLVKGLDPMPDFFFIADVRSYAHDILDMFTFREKPRHIDFSAMPEKLMVFFTDSVKIWSSQTKKFRTAYTGLKEFAFNYDFNEHFLVMSNGLNNTIELFDLRAGNNGQSARFISFGASNFFAQVPEGFYRTQGRSSRMNAYLNGTPVAFNSFDLMYNRPDKVMHQIGLADTALIAAMQHAFQKRLKRQGIADEKLLYQQSALPTVTIRNRHQLGYLQQDEVQLAIASQSAGTAFNSLQVWVNDVPLYGSSGLTLRPVHKLDTTLRIPLSAGDNRIEVAIKTTSGIESYREPLHVYNTNSHDQSKLYFIGLGVDNYSQRERNLRYSVKDIRDLAAKFQERYGKDLVVDTLFDQQVTQHNLAGLKQRLRNAGINDRVIIAYSGHGVLNNRFDYFLATSDMDFENPAIGGIPYEWMEGLLADIPSRRKLMLIDACHSGELDKAELDRIEQMQTALDTLGTTTDVQQKSSVKPRQKLGMRNSFQLMQELFVNLGQGTGATVISAAGGLQYAQERGSLQNGVFTYCILDAFNRNSTLSVQQLRQIVGENVERLTNGLQKPTSRSETINYDWRIW